METAKLFERSLSSPWAGIKPHFKRSRAIFRPASSKVRVQKVFLCPFHWKPRPSGVSLESPGLENIPQVAGNQPEVCQNHDARFLFPFHCKPRQARVSLESPWLENISQVPGNQAEVHQNHDARNVVSATVSVLKWSMAIFRPGSSKVSVQKVLLCPFHCKPWPSGISLESTELENIP